VGSDPATLARADDSQPLVSLRTRLGRPSCRPTGSAASLRRRRLLELIASGRSWRLSSRLQALSKPYVLAEAPAFPLHFEYVDRVTLDRDALDWAVAIAAALGGVASLIAVVIGVVSLSRANRLQEEVLAERRREWIRRRLGRLQEAALEVAKLATALGETNFNTAVLHWRQLRVILEVSDLRNELPKTRRIAEGFVPGEGNAMRDLSTRVLEEALPEVIEAIRRTYGELAAAGDRIREEVG
jgi:hypothetical protein